MEMIKVFSSANNSTEVTQKIPEALRAVKTFRQKLIDGEVPIWDLTVTKHLSKNIKSYRQHVSQMIAAEQLIKEGAEIHAGNNVKFIFTDSKNKRYQRRVVAEKLIEKGINADTQKYLILLYASAANLLSFKGYTAKSIYNAVNGQVSSDLIAYLN